MLQAATTETVEKVEVARKSHHRSRSRSKDRKRSHRSKVCHEISFAKCEVLFTDVKTSPIMEK